MHTLNPVHVKYCKQCTIEEINRLRVVSSELQKELSGLIDVGDRYTKAAETLEHSRQIEFKSGPHNPDSLKLPTDPDSLKLLTEKDQKQLTENFSETQTVDFYAKEIEVELLDIERTLTFALRSRHEENAEISTKLMCAQEELDVLRKCNVWHLLFPIYIDNDYALINGYRFAILHPFDMYQLNAAFGVCVLLLHCMAKTKGWRWKYYQPMPFGRRSYFIDKQQTRLNLFVDESTKSWKTSINSGIKALLVCLKEIELSTRIQLPGNIDLKTDTISNVSYTFPEILDISTSRNWNQAGRYILSNFKVILKTFV